MSKCSSNSTDPCQTYTVLDATLRNHETTRENNGICDTQLVERWYRVEIQGRPAEIPTVCLKNNVCGTQLPLRIDLDGKVMPTHNNTIEAYACTSYNVLGQWDCCVLRQKVRIKNCIHFYVYHLKPTDRCPVAYCAQEIGANVGATITRKRGDAFSGTVTNQPSDTTEISTLSNSNTTATADGTTEFIFTTETTVSSSNISVAEQNVTENMTPITSVSDSVSEKTTYYSTTHESELSTDLYSNVTTSETSTNNENSTVNYQTTTGGSAALNQTTNDSRVTPTENTTAHVSQGTIPTRICMSWPSVMCPDNQSVCYLSPVNNETYIPCANDSRCGILCDNIPDCDDHSDETICDVPLCLEGQQICPGRRGCHIRCGGRKQAKPSTSSMTEVSTATVNVTETLEMSSRFPNQTSTADIRSTDGNKTVTEALTSNVTDTFFTVSTGNSDISVTYATTVVTNDTVEHTNFTERTTISRTEFTSSLSTPDYETTNGSAEDVLVTQLSRNLTTEAARVFSADASPDVADTATNASITRSITSSGNASFTEISFTTSVPSLTTGLLSSTDSDTLLSTEIQLQTTPVSSRVTGVSQTETAPRLETTVTSNQSLSTSTFETTQPLMSSNQSLSTRTMETTQPLVSSNQSISTRIIETTQPLMSSNQSLSTRIMETTQSLVSSDQSLSTGPMETTQQLVSTDSATKQLSAMTSEITTEESTVVNYVSTTTLAPLQTTSKSIPDLTSTQDEHQSTSHAADFSTGRDTVTETVSGTTATDKVTSDTANTSAQYSSATGSQPTSAGENQTDQTIVIRKEREGLIYKNFGLFVFLVVAGVIILGIIIFGVIGYTYRRRLRTWNPTMAYQDAYGDMEKTNLSFGRDKHGIESPIPDFDILRDEKKFEETSLSQASTLALGPTPGRHEPPFDDTIGDWSPNKLTNGNPTQGVPQQNNEVSYITNGQNNEGFAAEDNVDGIVPVDELDTSPPRALFPWIENAEDTKL